MIKMWIFKLMGWNNFRYCPLTKRWYGFPPGNSLYVDVPLPPLKEILHGNAY